MASFTVRCPHCHATLRAPQTCPDRIVRCKKCQARLRLPPVVQPVVQPVAEQFDFRDAEPEAAEPEAPVRRRKLGSSIRWVVVWIGVSLTAAVLVLGLFCGGFLLLGQLGEVRRALAPASPRVENPPASPDFRLSPWQETGRGENFFHQRVVRMQATLTNTSNHELSYSFGGVNIVECYDAAGKKTASRFLYFPDLRPGESTDVTLGLSEDVVVVKISFKPHDKKLADFAWPPDK